MEKQLPARPNLDHLRRQAKTLLADLAAAKPDAIATILKHLPAAKKLTAGEAANTRFRLADAQSAIARKSGFAAWPHLARHVELLRELEGIWGFASLEVDGSKMPAEMLTLSRLLIDGDRFRTESPEGDYEGIFNINVETHPHAIDIEFVAGPEAGNWNYGIFRFADDQLELCLDLNGKPRPAEFKTTPGSGHAHEILKRVERIRPDKVAGGTPPTPKAKEAATGAEGFEFVSSPTLRKLEGEWSATRIIRDGMELPSAILRTATRAATGNEIKVAIGGKIVIHALARIDESCSPTHIDYYNLGGMAKGTVQAGLFKWDGDEACFCIAAPGQPRPVSFDAPAGSGRSLSQWRLKK